MFTSHFYGYPWDAWFGYSLEEGERRQEQEERTEEKNEKEAGENRE